MNPKPDEPDWPARFAALSGMDGDDWGDESDRLMEEWQAAYGAAFVEIAVSRGWNRENAESWPEHTEDEAYMNAHEHDHCPRKMAELDVIACEEPI